MDYDNETDRLVGFVFPCTKNGLPRTDSFVALSFESMKEAFHDCEIAKYAFVYMAQPLTQGVPAFCLACLGTNNKFTAEHVLRRWKYVFLECKKLGITVVSFGADGDSRELKSMQVSTHLLFSSANPMASLSPSSSSDNVSIPTEWRQSWFAVKKPTEISYVQDIVHVAVKLKSRLIKPSIVLPLGKYVAGVHHLRLVHNNFNKDEHGLRERDINHKDKQNYEAVLRMTSKSMFHLLKSVPDAKGTSTYLYTLRCVVDSYLDKSLQPLECIRKAWFAVFFMRYWHQWIVLNSHYTLGNNFITLNAYMCIELNAHSLIIFLLTLQKVLPDGGFLPWLLGSQSCEKAFRAARSMSSIFSTVINFGMLGLLRRLHRMHVQFCLEAESQKTGIKYPRIEAHKAKDGHGKTTFQSVGSVTDKEIAKAVMDSKEEAKEMIKDLGMFELLHSKDCWENPPTPLLEEADAYDDDDDMQDEDVAGDGVTTELLQEANSSQDNDAVASGISDLFKAGMITKKGNENLTALHKSAFKQVPSNTIPLFEETKSTRSKHQYCPFVRIQQDGRDLFINKTTVVWLLQESEKVSSDRLFRVRNKQPYANDSLKSCVSHSAIKQPSYCKEVAIGDICVFEDSSNWQVGKILQFSYYKEKAKAAQQYRGLVAEVIGTGSVGILCTWYSKSKESDVHTYAPQFSPTVQPLPSTDSSHIQALEEVHSYVPMSSYVCTLPHGCFEGIENKCSTTVKSVYQHDEKALCLTTAYKLTLTAEALTGVKQLLEVRQERKAMDTAKSVKQRAASKSSSEIVEECWTQFGEYILNRKHLQQLIQGKQLCDLHINAFQSLLKKSFPHIGGLQCTLYQNKTPLLLTPGTLVIQIIHTRNSHWVTLCIEDGSICLYDSAYTSVCKETLETIANLIHCKEKSFTVQIMNVHKQTGVVDCSLYAIATATCLAFKNDPTGVVFDQEELRTHFALCMESGKITLFPTCKKRRPASRVSGTEECCVYCVCRLPDRGQLMVCCSHCSDWFHQECITETIPKSRDLEKWIYVCNACKFK